MDPFRVEGPACISFSGGRTSGYMLWRILQAHGGTLPEDVVVCFANTGKEMPQTLDFVKECGERWGVQIVWLEYRNKSPREFAVVGYWTASRNGEPLAAAIKHRNFLPNPIARFCTVECKVLTIEAYCRSLGWDEWTSVIGIRADEPRRVAKMRANPSGSRRGVERIVPLADAGVTSADVLAFWGAQPFDLALPTINGRTMHGNCDLCFLKGVDQILALVREDPQRAVWWANMESLALAPKPSGAVFHLDRPSYAAMYEMATKHVELFEFHDEPIEDCACTD